MKLRNKIIILVHGLLLIICSVGYSRINDKNHNFVCIKSAAIQDNKNRSEYYKKLDDELDRDKNAIIEQLQKKNNITQIDFFNYMKKIVCIFDHDGMLDHAENLYDIRNQMLIQASAFKSRKSYELAFGQLDTESKVLLGECFEAIKEMKEDPSFTN